MTIELEKWTPAMKGELMRICNAAERTFLSNRMPYPYTADDAEWWLNMVTEQDGKGGLFRAIVVDGAVAGNITLERKADVFSKDAEIGYLLLREYWSRGIMTEAVRRMCALAFAELDIIRITGLVYAPNAASQRVLEKSGFTREGTQKNAVCKDGRVYDLCLFGMLRPAPPES